jgi:hypothetical protein
LHEIRNKINKKIEKQTPDKLNEDAKNKFNEWKKENKQQLVEC